MFDVESGQFTGFLDVKDLVSFVVFIDMEKSVGLPTTVDEIVNMVGPAFFGIPIEGVTATCEVLLRARRLQALPCRGRNTTKVVVLFLMENACCQICRGGTRSSPFRRATPCSLCVNCCLKRAYRWAAPLFASVLHVVINLRVFPASAGASGRQTREHRSRSLL